MSSEPTSESDDVLTEEEAQFGQTENIDPGDVPEGVVPEMGGEESAESKPDQEDEDDEESTAHGTGEPVPWAFEQEYEFRERLLSAPGVADIRQALDRMEAEFGAWDDILVSCAHLDGERYDQIYRLFEEAVEFFDVPMPEIYIDPERPVCPIVVRANPGAVTVTTGVTKAFEDPELRFVVGRLIAHLALEDHEYEHIVTVVLQRTPATITNVEQARLEVLGDYAAGWDAGLSLQQRQQTEKMAHAWDVRNELSVDRGALLFSGKPKTACHAIAKATCRDGESAADLEYSEFISEFEGMNPDELAKIDTDQDPMRSAQYGAYRILMLKWWAQSEQYQTLAEA